MNSGLPMNFMQHSLVRLYPLSEDLFDKKMFTSIVLNPITGSLESIQIENVKK